jgi:curved DNA-binding protein CbpA
MIDYYNILNLNNNATEKEIFTAYREKISQFNNLPFLTNKMIIEIKKIKEAFYVLNDNTKKEKYDRKLNKYNEYFVDNDTFDNTKICDRLFSIKFT